MAVLVYVFIALLMALGALYFIWTGQEQAREEMVAKRLSSVGVQAIEFPAKDKLTVYLERAGIYLDVNHRRMILWVVFLLVVLCAFQFGIALALLLTFGLVFFSYTALGVLYTRRQGLIVTQLPRLLDQVVRLMRSGKTLGDGFAIATKDADEPLRIVMQKLQRNIALGMTITEAFQELSDTYNLKELQVLALGVSVNSRYGGSLIDLLNNVITLIHQREHLSRQLRAMTGETRTSAVVLSALPLLVGTFMIFSNPDYIFTMIDDPSGKWVLYTAAAMQITGMGIIWRMLRSV